MERQRILLIFIGAWISAGLLVWILYSSTKAPKVEKTIAIQAAARDMAAGTLLHKADLKVVRVPENDVPKLAIRDANQAVDHPLLFPVSANELITLARIGSSTGVDGLAASIEPGKRAIAVPITDASGVAGLIQPRSHVDVLFTRPGQPADAVTTTILEDAIVLAIGRNTEGTSAAAAQSIAQTARPSTTSATLLVTPEQAQRIELAKNQGKISLALRNPLDHSSAEDPGATTSHELYPFTEVARTKPAPVVDKPPVIVQKKEPPKPKNVIDVYRGEKHVQEVFP
ncbi:MAG TPA: Flp pilus assembly protein CpaB [Bryobacteraceae bacterium]|jgi:pilus assembly protein CpaB|nr:Flp pilus assembly protein CpaB [Bryobacteraceae bacterium]